MAIASCERSRRYLPSVHRLKYPRIAKLTCWKKHAGGRQRVRVIVRRAAWISLQLSGSGAWMVTHQYITYIVLNRHSQPVYSTTIDYTLSPEYTKWTKRFRLKVAAIGLNCDHSTFTKLKCDFPMSMPKLTGPIPRAYYPPGLENVVITGHIEADMGRGGPNTFRWVE